MLALFILDELELLDPEVIPLLTTMLLNSSKSTTPPCSLAASESNFSAEIVVAFDSSHSASKFRLRRALGVVGALPPLGAGLILLRSMMYGKLERTEKPQYLLGVLYPIGMHEELPE